MPFGAGVINANKISEFINAYKFEFVLLAIFIWVIWFSITHYNEISEWGEGLS